MVQAIQDMCSTYIARTNQRNLSTTQMRNCDRAMVNVLSAKQGGRHRAVSFASTSSCGQSTPISISYDYEGRRIEDLDDYAHDCHHRLWLMQTRMDESRRRRPRERESESHDDSTEALSKPHTSRPPCEQRCPKSEGYMLDPDSDDCQDCVFCME